jgi:hypothetical protein
MAVSGRFLPVRRHQQDLVFSVLSVAVYVVLLVDGPFTVKPPCPSSNNLHLPDLVESDPSLSFASCGGVEMDPMSADLACSFPSNKIPCFSRGAPPLPVLRKSSRWRPRSGVEDGVPDRVGAHPWWLTWSGYGACYGDWPPAGSTSAPYLLAEWRPFFYLQAKEPKGRQCCFFTESATWSLGGLAVPSGVVPGDGEVVPVEKKHRTRLRFPSLFWGPLCKSQGPVCYFLLVWGPDVICCVPACLY